MDRTAPELHEPDRETPFKFLHCPGCKCYISMGCLEFPQCSSRFFYSGLVDPPRIRPPYTGGPSVAGRALSGVVRRCYAVLSPCFPLGQRQEHIAPREALVFHCQGRPSWDRAPSEYFAGGRRAPSRVPTRYQTVGVRRGRFPSEVDGPSQGPPQRSRPVWSSLRVVNHMSGFDMPGSGAASAHHTWRRASVSRASRGARATSSSARTGDAWNSRGVRALRPSTKVVAGRLPLARSGGALGTAF